MATQRKNKHLLNKKVNVWSHSDVLICWFNCYGIQTYPSTSRHVTNVMQFIMDKINVNGSCSSYLTVARLKGKNFQVFN